MTVKAYGAGVSGYLDPEGRNWETVVYQAGKPVIDTEQNLIQDATQQLLRRNGPPSGWLDPNTTDSVAPTGIVNASTVANRLDLDPMTAYVNGWRINVTDTVTTGANWLDLGTAPVGAGAKRFDLVILEVWRRVIEAAPSTAGKSPAGYIWRYGNVKAVDQDATLNYADDVQDPNVGAPTTKRVQIQYRLRVIQDVDLWSYPFGINDPSVVARTVPATPAAPNGVATAYPFVNQSSAGDSGLWRAGDGNPVNGLGTVDGYIYAVPLGVVTRRNNAAFSRISNHNGGVAYPAASDRPDGLHYDVIDARDLLDLRTSVRFDGWNYPELLQKNTYWLLDNALRGEIGETLNGGGVQGSNLLNAVEIGVSNANGGTPPLTGDTTGADFIGEFDGIRRTFSDQPVIETVWLRYEPVDLGYPGGWPMTDFTVTIDPTNIIPEGHPSYNWSAHAPSTASILTVDATYLEMGDIWYRNSTMVQGVGTVPQGSISIRFPSALGFSTGSLFIKIVVGYPPGVGMVKHPSRAFNAVNSFVWNNPGSLPADYEGDEVRAIDFAHRGVDYQYRTVMAVKTVYAGANYATTVVEDFIASRDVLIRDRVDSVTSITINAVPYLGSIAINHSNQTLRLDPGSLTVGNAIVVTYKAQRAMQQIGAQLTVYYETAPMQTVREALAGTSLNLIPRYVSPELYVLVGGPGSLGEAYPFPSQTTQTGGIYPTSAGSYSGDHEHRSGILHLQDFNLDTGFGKVLATVPLVTNPNELTLERDPGDRDIEDRVFYKRVPAGYLPSAFGPPLAEPVAHRVLLPVLCELSADGPFGFKGQLVLATLQRWAPGVADNAVAFDLNLASNWTSASVYRLKGNPLNSRVA